MTRAIERVGALQAQWPPSPYVALWSRLERFSHEALMRSVERRRVVKATLMRTTLHLVTSRDYLAYAGVFLRRRIATIERQLAKRDPDVDVDRLVREISAHVADEPRSRPELLDLLGRPKLTVDDRRPWLDWYLLAAKAHLVHSPSSVVWRAHTGGGKFARAETWLGGVPAEGDAAVMHLVRRYLAAFGPASRADIGQWTGLPLAALEPGLAALELRRFRDERGRVLLDLPRAPLPPADSAAPPRFLPLWDSTLLAHDDRTRILPEAYREAVIDGGWVYATFLVDGFVAGTWAVEDGRVVLEPFEPLPRAVLRDLEAEGRALARFYV